MKKYALIMLVMGISATSQIYSQEDLQLTSKDSIVQSSWVLGLGYNIVDDSATPFGDDFLNIKDTWNALAYPSRISIGRFFKNGIGLEAIGSYNKYKVGKTVDGNINTTPRDYYALDGQISYDLNKVFGETGWFDPYIHAGAGYSSIGSIGRTTANAGFGFNTWFSDKWGLNFNTMGKWGIKEGSTKQLQHSAGVAYRFGIEKELSKKGKEKLALIEALEKENQRVADSLANVQREKDAAELAKRLADEKEKARLAAIEKERMDAENQRKQLEDAIKDLGKVYFNLNSSYVKKDAKVVLDGLSDLLKETETIKLLITSHTDARGTKKYNQWLSQRRVDRTKEYLVKNGIEPERLETQGQGEENLLNECDDNTYCSEEKHKINRRSEFKVTDF